MKSGYIAAILLVGLSLCGAAAVTEIPLSESLANGDFSKPLSQGWATFAGDIVGDHSVTATKANGATVLKKMCGTAMLEQDVKLATTNMVFSTRARFRCQATREPYYATSSILLGFLDKDGETLGETRIYAAAGVLPWKASDRLNLIRASAAGKWQDYSLNLRDELQANLRGVDPAEVKRLRVSLESFCSGEDAC